MIKRFLILALLICLATGIVSAVNSGDDVGHAQLFENKYYNNNPAIREVLPPASYGWAIFRVRGVNVQDPYIFVDRDPSNKSVNLTFNPDQTMIENENPGMLLVKLMPNGVSEPIQFQAGCWNAYMRRGNADQPEKQRFCTGTGATEYVTFLGAAIPTLHKEICEVFTVIDVPGFIIHHDEVNHTEYRYWIVGNEPIPAWTEHFGDYNADHVNVGMGNGDYTRSGSGVVDPYVFTYVAPTHYDATPATGVKAAWICTEYWRDFCTHWDYEFGHVHARQNGNPSQTDFWYNGQRFHITGDKHDDAFIVTPGTPAYDLHNGDYNAAHEYVGIGNGDYTRTGSGINDPYIYTYIAPIEHPAIPGSGAWSEWSKTMDGGDVKYETRLVVDTPAYDEQVGAITHEETVCNKYGEPVPPENSIPRQPVFA